MAPYFFVKKKILHGTKANPMGASVDIDIDLNVVDIQYPTSTSVIPISKKNISD
jgi:hypothetical protein